jgi:hypothetical protein
MYCSQRNNVFHTLLRRELHWTARQASLSVHVRVNSWIGLVSLDWSTHSTCFVARGESEVPDLSCQVRARGASYELSRFICHLCYMIWILWKLLHYTSVAQWSVHVDYRWHPQDIGYNIIMTEGRYIQQSYSCRWDEVNDRSARLLTEQYG